MPHPPAMPCGAGRRDPRRLAGRLTVLAIIAVLAVLAPFGPAAHSDPSAELAANDKRLAEIKKVLADARADLDSVAKAEQQAAAELARAEAAVRAANTEVANAAAERAAAATQAARLTGELAQLEAAAGRRARALYMTGGGGAMAAVISTEDPQDLLDRALRIEQQAHADNELRAGLAEARRMAADAQAHLAEVEARARAAVAAARARADELREVREVRAEARRKLNERIAAYQAEYRAIEEESRRIRLLLQQGGDDLVADTGPPSALGLRRPVNCPKTSGFGPRWGRMHEGVDYGCPTGTPVGASAAGTVVSAGWSNGYGYLVLIDHGSVVTAYAHNSKLLVSAGQKVVAGQTVALSGSTGNSTGPHVHFEVRVNGVPRNPEAYV